MCCLYARLRPETRQTAGLARWFRHSVHPALEGRQSGTSWLDAIKTGATLSSYETLERVADRLQKNNTRLTRERALWLAAHWAEQKDDGRWHLRADPAHKLPFPTVYRLEVIGIWQRDRTDLWLGASESDAVRNGYTDESFAPETRDGHAPGSFASRPAAFHDIRF